MRYRPKAPKGYSWDSNDCLVADCGCVESSHEVTLTFAALAALKNGAQVVNGRVPATFWVEVEEVPCTV